MRYRIEGFVSRSVSTGGSGDFTLEIEAGSSQAAGVEARRQIAASTKLFLFDEVIICDIHQIITGALDELGKLILQIISKKWLTENDHLKEFGYSPDTLSKDFGLSQGGGGPKFRYIHPGTCISTKDIRTKFPQEMAPLIRAAASNRQEAEKAIELVFARIKVEESTGADGDHHSMTYGQPAFSAYYIVADEAFELASKTQELRQLI